MILHILKEDKDKIYLEHQTGDVFVLTPSTNNVSYIYMYNICRCNL